MDIYIYNNIYTNNIVKISPPETKKQKKGFFVTKEKIIQDTCAKST